MAPDDPASLPRHRRPRDLGGTGRTPVWEIDEELLGPRLAYRPDPTKPEVHGFITGTFGS